MNCVLNIRASNGKNSQLFKDIANDIKDLNKAVEMYYYTKTDEFDKAYKGSYDENGDAIYSQISKEVYDGIEDYHNVHLSNNVRVYQELLRTVPLMVDLLNKRIKQIRSTRKDDKGAIEKLDRIVTLLQRDDITTSVPKFLEMAGGATKNLAKLAIEASADPNVDIGYLASLNKIAQTYGIVNELRTAVSLVDAKEIFGDQIWGLKSVTENITQVEQAYINKSIDYLADEFHKRDKTWSKTDIKKALRQAPKDIVYHEQMLEYMGDSSDRVLAMVAEIMRETQHTIRRLEIEFNEQLAERAARLEAAYPKNKDLFAKAIIKHDDGSLHVLNPDVSVNVKYPSKLNSAMAQRLKELQNETELIDFLRFYHENMNKLQKALPGQGQIGTRIPTVLKSELELLQGKDLKEKAKLIQDKVAKTFQASNLDLERGELVDSRGAFIKRVPTFFTQKYDTADYDSKFSELEKKYIKEGMDEEDAQKKAHREAEIYATEKMSSLVSTDLLSSLQAFHSMATNYAAKNEHIHIFESAEAIVSSKHREYIQTDSNGRPIIKDGVIQTKSGADSYAGKMIKTFLEMQLYNKKQNNLGFYQVGNYTIDWNKTLRYVNSSTGLIMQAGNVMGGIANWAVGTFNNWLESVGGEFYKPGNMTKATAFYNSQLFNTMGDIGARVPESFVGQFSEHYNVMGDYSRDRIKTTERNKAARLFKTSTLYFVQNAAEHGMHHKAAFAVMDNMKAYDKNGNDLGSLLDQHRGEKNKFKVPADVYVKDKDGTLVKYDTAQQNRVANRISAVLRKLHGNYAGETANKMHQDAVTAMMIKFRGWMYEGIMRRYGRQRYYQPLDMEIEGYYRTGGRVLLNMAKELRSLNFALMKENWRNLSAHEKANVHRFITETSMIIATSIGAAVLSGAGKLMDEYDTNDPFDRFILGSFEMFNYQVNRLNTEIFAYVNPAEAMKLLATPMASVSIAENVARLIGQTLSPFETYETGWRKGDNKLLVRAEKLIPLYKQIATLNPDGIRERAQWFIN